MKLLLPSFLLRALVVSLVLGSWTPFAHAHPGHGLGEGGVAHVLSSPYHLCVMTLAGAALWFCARFVQNKFPRRALQFLGVAILVASALL